MKPKANSPRLTQLYQAYRELDYKCGIQCDRIRNGRNYEMDLFVPTPDAKHNEEKVLNQLLQEASSLPAPDPVFAILKSHFIDFIQSQQSSLDGMYEYPSSFISSLTYFLTFLGGQDSRSAGERAKILINRINLVDNLWAALTEFFPKTSTTQLKEVKAACEMLSQVAAIEKSKVNKEYQGLSQKDMDNVSKSVGTLAAKAHLWAQEAGRTIENRHEITESNNSNENMAAVGVGPDRYRAILDKELGVSLDELLSWYEDEVEKTRVEFVEAAARLNLPGRTVRSPLDAVDIMNTYAGPADSPEEMFARMREYLARAKKACRDWVKMPEEDCRVVPVYEQCRYTYPWGGYGGGCSRRRPLLGEVFLNDTNYRAITDGWIKINAVHECYPGHHVQWVRGTLDPLPQTVKLGAKRVPLHEGMCHRTERLMEYIYDDDPFYPLAVAYRRHHTSVRIKADLYMQYFGRPVEDAIKLYMNEMGFDYETAKGQAVSQLPQNRIGYFTCYYYGMKKLEDLEEKYGFDKKTFTEYLFSVLNISLDNFEAFLKLSDEDKNRFLTKFPSKLQFD